MRGMDALKTDIAAAAARWVVEEGLEYGPAKRRALRDMGLPARTALPDNATLEDAVRDHIALFCADTQPAEMAALRQEALRWMQRLSAFRPYLCGAVWHGTATRLSDVTLQLFCDDPKSLEIELINQGLDFEVREVAGLRGEAVDALSLHSFNRDLGEDVGIHLLVHDYDDLRGALRPDAKGRVPRGNLQALRERMDAIRHDARP